MQVETVDFLTIPTRDIERSMAFYTDVLGLERGAEGEVEAPNVTISFWNPERDGEEFRPHVGGFAIRVADVEEARRELESRGVRFKGETYDSGACHVGRYAPRG